MFRTYTEFNPLRPVSGYNGLLKAIGFGRIELEAKGGNGEKRTLSIEDVWYVPGGSFNLISQG